LTVIDAHHHVWDPSRAEYAWMTDRLAPVRRRFDLEDLRPLLAVAGVDRTVLVQTRSSREETAEFLALAAPGSPVVGVVGWADLTGPDVADAIASLRQGSGGSRLVGIRHQVHDEPDPRWLERANVVRGLRAVEAAGLAYDLLVRARELPSALTVARSLPDLRFVIDHAAKPPLAAGDLGEWRSRIVPLAALPNVACKLSGLVTEADWSSWTPGDLEPAVEVVLEAFGPDRTMFGSDWPVCLLAADYPTVVETLQQLTVELSIPERAALFGGTAAAWYGLALE
jgi:L-fuconolactonase